MDKVRLRDSWTGWGRSGGVLSVAQESASWEISTMAPRLMTKALDAVATGVAEGLSLDEAIARAPEAREPHVLEVHEVSQGILVIDDTATIGANNAVDSLKVVTSVAARERRVVVVAGAIDFTGDSDYDSLGAFGALMVRLNVDQVFAVGPEARALFLSVGMEGSWDGESQHCPSVDDAYDVVRAFLRPEDVVLVMGTTRESLSPLVGRLLEDLS